MSLVDACRASQQACCCTSTDTSTDTAMQPATNGQFELVLFVLLLWSLQLAMCLTSAVLTCFFCKMTIRFHIVCMAPRWVMHNTSLSQMQRVQHKMRWHPQPAHMQTCQQPPSRPLQAAERTIKATPKPVFRANPSTPVQA